jgi:hypothetical protein
VLTPEEFKKQWHSKSGSIHELITISWSVLDGIAIPNDAKHFLAEAGVPLYEYMGNPVNPLLPQLPHSYRGTKTLPASFSRFRVFGDRSYRYFCCLDEKEQGRIVHIRVTTEQSRKQNTLYLEKLASDEAYYSELSDDELIDVESEEELYELFDKEELPPLSDEDDPVETEIIFVNSSIQQLAACWLLARKFAEMIETFEIWHDDKLRNEYVQRWDEEIRAIDPKAVEDETTEWSDRLSSVRRKCIQ